MKLFLDTNIQNNDFNKFTFKNTFRFKVYGDILRRECLYNDDPYASLINKDNKDRKERIIKLKFIKRKKKTHFSKNQGSYNTGRCF